MNIKVGDKVDICWEYIGSEYNLEVLYIPFKPCECWILKRDDGTIVNTCYFGRMIKSKGY